jgi:hypothetical protein
MISCAITSCFYALLLLITPSSPLEGPWLTLSGEPQGCGVPARRAANDHPTPRCQSAEALADIPLISLEGADQCLVAPRDPPLRPLVIGGQPA